MSKRRRNFGEVLQGMSRHTLYALLFIAASVPLFFKIEVPNKPDDQTIDLFVYLMKLPKDKPVIIESDWTLSTRGESAGQLEALLRILMRNETKFLIFSGADPQAPQVARNILRRINEERVASGERKYERWNDYIDVGYYPDLAAMSNAIGINIRKAFGGKRDVAPGKGLTDIFQSPVLESVKSVGDVGLYINITASGTIDVLVERLYGKVPLALMCTGVMGPQSVPYYQAKQLVGISIGLKGVYDLETMMEYGVRGERAPDGPPKRVVSKNPSIAKETIEGFAGKRNFDRAGSYYPTLHVALFLLILAVVAGNVGLALTRRNGGSR